MNFPLINSFVLFSAASLMFRALLVLQVYPPQFCNPHPLPPPVWYTLSSPSYPRKLPILPDPMLFQSLAQNPPSPQHFSWLLQLIHSTANSDRVLALGEALCLIEAGMDHGQDRVPILQSAPPITTSLNPMAPSSISPPVFTAEPDVLLTLFMLTFSEKWGKAVKEPRL